MAEFEASPSVVEVADDTPAEPVWPAEGWPEDWRARMAGDDERLLRRLERFPHPGGVLQSFLSLEQKMSSGAARPMPEADADPEDWAAWRAENGLPESPDGYLDKLPGGLVAGEADRPMLNAFAERMHGLNAPPEVVGEAVAWYYDQVEEQIAERARTDAAFRAEADAALRREWGGRYRANLNALNGLLDTAPEGVKANLFGARLADGRPLGDHPEVLRFLVRLANEVNPAGTVAPSGGTTAQRTLADEMAGIEKLMADRHSDYWRDDALQARYRELIEARDRLARR
jgi:hypothetical protein